MEDFKFQLYIVTDKDEISAELIHDKKRLKFDLSNVIGDFLEIRNSKFFEKNKMKACKGHPFTDYFHYIFPYVLEDYGQRHYESIEKAFICIDKYLDLQSSNKSNSLYLKFETMKTHLELTFSYSISLLDAENSIQGTRSYGTPLMDFSNLNNNYSWFTYTCFSIPDMIAAVLHYYLVNGYKIQLCKHCEKYFATKTLKEQYCHRKSKYKNSYSQKKSKPVNCEQTVRNELQQLKNKKIRIDNRMRQSAKFQTGEDLSCLAFRNDCHEHTQRVKEHPTVDHLTLFNQYLYKTEQELKGKSK